MNVSLHVTVRHSTHFRTVFSTLDSQSDVLARRQPIQFQLGVSHRKLVTSDYIPCTPWGHSTFPIKGTTRGSVTK